MILGVVLGNMAELNLARALAITPDLTPFFTRPWSLFFLIIALFIAVFRCFKNIAAGRLGLITCPLRASRLLYLYMMGGVPRPIIATIIVTFGAWTLFRRWKSGWALD